MQEVHYEDVAGYKATNRILSRMSYGRELGLIWVDMVTEADVDGRGPETVFNIYVGGVLEGTTNYLQNAINAFNRAEEILANEHNRKTPMKHFLAYHIL